MSSSKPVLLASASSRIDRLRRAHGEPLRLLVSVRDAQEALVALSGGADVIDVKEPSRGALGRADDETLRAVAQAIDGRAPLSFAGGEAINRAKLTRAIEVSRARAMPTSPKEAWACKPESASERDLCERPIQAESAECGEPTSHAHAADATWAWHAPGSGFAFFKYGPAGLAARSDWREILVEAWRSAAPGASPIAVAYADYSDAEAPAPEAIVTLAIEFGCAGVLFDTFGKSPRLGLTALPEARLTACIVQARAAGLLVSLAGSLGPRDAADVARLGADLIAVRGAACSHGRESRVDSNRIASLKTALAREAEARRDFDAPRERSGMRDRA